MNMVGHLLIAATIAVLSLMCQVSANKCFGRPAVIEGYTSMCRSDNSLAVFSESQSCLTREVDLNPNRTCTPSAGCAEVNFKIKPGQYRNTADFIWSVAVCYSGGQMELAFCMPGTELVTTTPGPTTPPVAPSGSAQTEDLQTTTEGSTSTTSTSTTSTSTTSTTTTSTTSTSTTSTTTTATTTTGPTTTTETLPVLSGCIQGALFFEPTCTRGDEVNGYGQLYTDAALTLTEGIYVNVTGTVVGCCTGDKCRADDGVTRDNTCLYGDHTGTSEIMCKDECFGYLFIDSSGALTAQYGCLADLDLTGSNWAGATSCTSEYEDGTCNDANSETECMKCCSGSSCNSWNSKNSLLGIVPETSQSAATHALPSVLLLVATIVAAL